MSSLDHVMYIYYGYYGNEVMGGFMTELFCEIC